MEDLRERARRSIITKRPVVVSSENKEEEPTQVTNEPIGERKKKNDEINSTILIYLFLYYRLIP